MDKSKINEIIISELNRYSETIYIFDFDETLISDNANVHVTKQNGDKFTLNQKQYKKYIKEPGDQLDISEFDTVNDPIPNMELIALAKSLQDKSIVLTARSVEKPIKDYLSTLEIDMPVHAIGSSDPNVISAAYNATKKCEWVENLINNFDIKNIEVWDDNRLNLHKIQSLKTKYPAITIKTHLVKFGPRR